MTTQTQKIAALEAAVAALAERQDKADAMRVDTHNMVADMQAKVDALHDALMKPQMGQGNLTAIERIMNVTVGVETFMRAGTAARWLAAVIVACGVIIAVFSWGPKV